MEIEAVKSVPLEDLFSMAAQARSEGRQPVLQAVYPQGTLAVSVTGKSCALDCPHCGGHYLERMTPLADLPEELASRKPTSILLSGGCDLSGAVPLAHGLARARELADPEGAGERRFKINAHPGVASPEAAKAIADAADVISYDFVLDDGTIAEAFGGRWTGRDYVETLRNLRSGRAEVVPHVLIGLKRGQIAGEHEAVRFLLDEGIKRIIFIVFIPTPGSRWASVPPPPVQDVARVIAWTRVSAPGLDISLGCMRPGGTYRRQLDVVAVKCGVDRIVLPHPDALESARSMGLEIVKKEECCAFV